MVQLRHILVPTDFSECSDVAVRYARAFAEPFQATLHLLHVVQDPYTQPWAAEAFAAPLGDMLQDWQVRARERLDALAKGPDATRTIVSVQTGSPFYEIVRYASEQHIDLIVMGTHGRGPIGHMLLGSVTEKVVRKAPCPVLTVRQPPHAPAA
jgi:nucleotide-binding universal stress UspA family protein